jgi:UDP-glucose 4-epimerase
VVVFTSSREVYGEPSSLPVSEDASLKPKNVYGASKAAAEMYCRIFDSLDLQVRIVRLANVYGHRDSDRAIAILANNGIRGEPLTFLAANKLSILYG